MSVGVIEIIMAAVLAVLAAAAVVTAAVLVAAASLSATTLATAPIAESLRRRQRRAWHPPTTWIPPDLDQIRPTVPRPVPVRGLSLVASRHPDAAVDLIAAQVTPPGADTATGPRRLTMVRARLQPAATLDLPAHASGPLLVFVVAGRGTLGNGCGRLSAGETMTVAAGSRVRLGADAGPGTSGLEVLVFDAPAPAVAAPRVPASAVTVRRHRVRRHRVRRPRARPHVIRRPVLTGPRRARDLIPTQPTVST